jgi:hypothetical protein
VNQNVNPFVQANPFVNMDVPPYRFGNPFNEPHSQLPDHVVNEYARMGVMGFCKDDERVTITRREYNELVQSRKHAEELVHIVQSLEKQNTEHKETCRMLKQECDYEVYQLKMRHGNEEHRLKHDLENTRMCMSRELEKLLSDEKRKHDADVVQLRAQYNNQLSKASDQYQHSLDLLKQ